MILQSGLIVELFKCSKVSKWFLGKPLLDWSNNKENLTFSKSPYKVCRLVCGAFAVAQLVDLVPKLFFSTTKTSKGDPVSRLGIMFESLFIMIFIYSHETIQKCDLLNYFINQLVSFEKRYYKNQKGEKTMFKTFIDYLLTC